MFDHTPEPWILKGDYNMCIVDKDSRYIVDRFLLGTRSLEEQRANARRITACVNACRNISTEALESGMLSELLGLLI